MVSQDALVLIGEDEPDNQVILQTVVESLVGARAEVAGDGAGPDDAPAQFPVGGHVMLLTRGSGARVLAWATVLAEAGATRNIQ